MIHVNLYAHVHSERNIDLLDHQDEPIVLTEAWSRLVKNYAVACVSKSDLMVFEVEIRIPKSHTIDGIGVEDLAKMPGVHMGGDDPGFDHVSIVVEPEPLTMTMRVYAKDVPRAIDQAKSMLGWPEQERCKIIAANPAPATTKKGR